MKRLRLVISHKNEQNKQKYILNEPFETFRSFPAKELSFKYALCVGL